MRKSFLVELTKEEVLDFSNTDLEHREDLVKKAYSQIESDQLAEVFQDFCTKPRETYNDDAEVAGFDFDHANALTGTGLIEFVGTAYFGCDDLNRHYPEQVNFVFTVDLEGAKIEFAVDVPEPVVERVPDDEC